MYDLRSSNVTNRKIKSILLEKTEVAEKIKRTASIEKIQYLIFNETIDVELYKTIVASLTVGDELSLPFSKKIADILFFALCVNCNRKIGLNIRNINQANVLFELYENDYTKVEPEDNKKIIRFTKLKGNHPIFFSGYFITWKIPVSFFKGSDNKSYVTLSGLNYCIVIINDTEYKIPRSLYLNFFKSSMIRGRITCESTNELKDKFDLANVDALRSVFDYLGFVSKKELTNIQIPLGIVYVEDNKIYCSTEENKDNISVYWTNISNNTYVLLPKYNYIPIKSTNELTLVTLLV